MAYIGNTAGNRFVASQPASVYSGDGSTTVFTLEHSVASDEDILVSVDGVVQEPSVAYAVSGGTTLTFTSAPSNNAGNNIFVYYLFRTVATVDHPSTSSLLATDGTFTGDLTVDTNTLYVDSTNNRVGVGTSSPSTTLDLVGNWVSNTGQLSIDTPSGETYSGLAILNNGTPKGFLFHDSSVGSLDLQTYTTDSLRFKTDNTERMRIDSSGNLLVGTTDSSLYNNASGNGIQLNGATGQIVIAKESTSSADPAIWLNNTGVDGSICTLAKDGSVVGTIGTLSSRLHIENGDTGLRIAGDLDQIFPCGSGGGDRDAAIDLGSTGVRFKDLYLSGGAYLGGTGSANKLDDYEEGTWTPALTRGGTQPTLTYNYQNGHYVKVGSLVTVFFNMYVNTVTNSGTGSNYIGGLPFTSTSNTNFRAGGAIAFNNALVTSSAEGLRPQTSVGLDRLNLIIQTLDSTSAAAVLDTSITSSAFVQGSITYQTDA